MVRRVTAQWASAAGRGPMVRRDEVRRRAVRVWAVLLARAAGVFERARLRRQLETVDALLEKAQNDPIFRFILEAEVGASTDRLEEQY